MNRFSNDTHLVALRRNLGDVQALMERGILVEPDTGRSYFTGYSYKTLYDWDQYFEAIVQIYMGWQTEYIKNGVTIFLDHQRESGLISRSVPSNEHHDPEHVKPFLAQMALLVEKAAGERDWIVAEPYFSRLKRYLDYWLVEMDGDGNGLSEWMSAPHTGMDNQHERAGFWLDRFCEGVDLNCYLVRECRAFATVASWAGKDALVAEYIAEADARAGRIRALCWDEADGFFYDRNVRAGEYPMSRRAGWASALNVGAGERIRVKTVAGFAALWAGVATPEQARRMVFEHLFNGAEFWSAYPVPAMACTERWYSRDFHPADLGCDWRAKAWVPTNYMIYWGLRRYGYRELASLVAHATRRLVQVAGNREYYDAETGAGCGLDPFWGWSLLAHFMAYEEASETDITAI
jgi:putative isomerase